MAKRQGVEHESQLSRPAFSQGQTKAQSSQLLRTDEGPGLDESNSNNETTAKGKRESA